MVTKSEILEYILHKEISSTKHKEENKEYIAKIYVILSKMSKIKEILEE